MNISLDKQVRLQMGRPRYCYERKISREKLTLLIAAKNNAKRVNYVKAKIEFTLQNSKGRLCGDRNKTNNHIVIKCSKLA